MAFAPCPKARTQPHPSRRYLHLVRQPLSPDSYLPIGNQIPTYLTIRSSPRMTTMTTRALRNVLTVVGALLLAGAIFAACGGGSEPADDAAAGNDAAGPTEAVTDTSTDTTADTSTSGTAISFANDVQPVLEENCVSCHSGTGPGTTHLVICLLYTSPSPRDATLSRMPSSA